jgi:CheY-like chemotaxis protein
MSVLLRTQLESTDAFACEVVRDAAAALARLEACAFPLVIMDEVRRSDDHLLAFIDALAQLPPDRRPRTLLCTNRDHPSEHIPYLRMGYDSCLGKPFTKQMLLNAVHHLIAPSC